MKCPRCDVKLESFRYHGIEVDVCGECNGIFFDEDELKPYLHHVVEDRKQLEGRSIPNKTIIPKEGFDNADHLECPACECEMSPFNYAYSSNIILDKCHTCGGVWVDHPELEQLARHVKGSDLIRNLAKSLAERGHQTAKFKEFGSLAGEMKIGTQAQALGPLIVLPLRSESWTENNKPVFVSSLILINILIFIIQIFTVDDKSAFFQSFGFVPSQFFSGNQIRGIITSIFIHAGVLHILGNMFFLWMFGPNVEGLFGSKIFAISYLSWGIFGGLSHAVLHFNSTIPAIGASGAIAGILGAFLIVCPKARISTLVISRVVDIPSYIYLTLWIIFQIIYCVTGASGVGWLAHIGGFLAGMLTGYQMKKRGKLHLPQLSCPN